MSFMASSTGPSVVGLQVKHSATHYIQARTDDRKIYILDLVLLYSAPHAPFDEIVSPNHRRTAPRLISNGSDSRQAIQQPIVHALRSVVSQLGNFDTSDWTVENYHSFVIRNRDLNCFRDVIHQNRHVRKRIIVRTRLSVLARVVIFRKSVARLLSKGNKRRKLKLKGRAKGVRILSYKRAEDLRNYFSISG
ncbi:hypothetical protein AVEN_185851-1 [Araneus ventricosus]|uniref:Uncharacterized protein n=1 Tax=Araneus ventricosus TaxID=182803 RepID=A0A4Y2JJI3_ARAVE|nr:hypothetical protein AVEN_185851-1 [Araneus ventricosus]